MSIILIIPKERAKKFESQEGEEEEMKICAEYLLNRILEGKK